MIGRLFGKTKVTTERAEDEGTIPEGWQTRSLSEAEREALEQISNRTVWNGSLGGVSVGQQAHSYNTSIHNATTYPPKLYLGSEVLSENMLSVIKMSDCAHPALRESLVETLIALADSDSVSDRAFAVMHKDLPEAKRIMMLSDDDQNVVEIAKTILEWADE
jgi:hypothetical protein